MCAQLLSDAQLFVTSWIVACQAPLSIEFSRQKYWNVLPFPKQYSIVYTHNFFIHSFVDGHLSCFHVWAIENSAAMNIVGACTFSNYGFLQIYAQVWDSWVIWQLYVQFFKETPWPCALEGQDAAPPTSSQAPALPPARLYKLTDQSHQTRGRHQCICFFKKNVNYLKKVF